MTQQRTRREAPTHRTHRPNISTENQPAGAARRPSDTLDRQPADGDGEERRANDGE